jgi:hypothetical protein
MLLENRGVVDHCAAAQPYDHVQKKLEDEIVKCQSFGPRHTEEALPGLAPSRSTE